MATAITTPSTSMAQRSLFATTTLPSPAMPKMAPSPILQEGLEWTYQANSILSYIAVFLLIVGLIVNFINVIVFQKQGLQDGVTLSLFALSLSDFCLCIMLLGAAVMGSIKSWDPGHTLHPDSILVACFGYPRAIAYCYSTCVTVYLSLERSLCVILPFKFKTIFTRTVTVMALIFLAVFVVSWFVPIFATQGLTWRFDPRFNKSRLFMWRKPNIRDIHLVFIVSTSFVIPIVSQTMIGVSTALMIYGLQASTKFKKNNSSAATDGDQANQGLQGKELKAVRMVLSLSIIFFVCNLPLVMVAVTQIILPEFQLNRYYTRLYELIYGIVYFISAINATANFFVYYTHSSKFKQVCLGIFGCGGDAEQKK